MAEKSINNSLIQNENQCLQQYKACLQQQEEKNENQIQFDWIIYEVQNLEEEPAEIRYIEDFLQDHLNINVKQKQQLDLSEIKINEDNNDKLVENEDVDQFENNSDLQQKNNYLLSQVAQNIELRIKKYGELQIQKKRAKKINNFETNDNEYDLQDKFIDDAQVDEDLKQLAYYEAFVGDFNAIDGGLTETKVSQAFIDRLKLISEYRDTSKVVNKKKFNPIKKLNTHINEGNSKKQTKRNIKKPKSILDDEILKNNSNQIVTTVSSNQIENHIPKKNQTKKNNKQTKNATNNDQELSGNDSKQNEVQQKRKRKYQKEPELIMQTSIIQESYSKINPIDNMKI